MDHTWDDAQIQLAVDSLDPLHGVVGVVLLWRSMSLCTRVFHGMLGIPVVAHTEGFTCG
jgi:hypothetical protein